MSMENRKKTIDSRRIGLLTDIRLAEVMPSDVALWPIGSIEPHGHLPLATDSMLPTAILERVSLDVEGVWLLPTLPIGHLFKYGNWPGAIEMPHDAVTSTVTSVCQGLSRIGLRRLLVMSGHDENRESVIIGLQEGHKRFQISSVYCDWIDLAESLLPILNESGCESHASEIQTSVFMYLFPEISINLPERASESRQPPRIGADDLFAPRECGEWVSLVTQTLNLRNAPDSASASGEKGRQVVEHIIERCRAILESLREKD